MAHDRAVRPPTPMDDQSAAKFHKDHSVGKIVSSFFISLDVVVESPEQ
jgi:hypothetical protein